MLNRLLSIPGFVYVLIGIYIDAVFDAHTLALVFQGFGIGVAFRGMKIAKREAQESKDELINELKDELRFCKEHLDKIPYANIVRKYKLYDDMYKRLGSSFMFKDSAPIMAEIRDILKEKIDENKGLFL